VSLDPWERTGGEKVTEFGIFRVRRYLARSPRTGRDRPFTVLDTFEWVNVVAITPDQEHILVYHDRHGTDDFALEIPGGVVDPGEDPAHAAVRELREETGYAGDPVVHLGTVQPNPAIQSNRCATYLIRNAVRVGDLQLDPGEDIEVSTMPLRDVPRAVADGRIRHALVVCALWWHAQHDASFSPVPLR
jgi:8-oxo-dGTP pyrophosphatase MutT (NUDIX family)